MTVKRVLDAKSKLTGENKVSGSANAGKTSSARECPKHLNLIVTVKFFVGASLPPLFHYTKVQAFVAVDVSSLEITLILWNSVHSNHTIIIMIICFIVHLLATKQTQTKKILMGHKMELQKN